MDLLAPTQAELPGSIASGSELRLDPEQWLDRYGDALYRHAWARLRARSAAEDLVQQTLLEAFKARDRYNGKVSEKNWLFTILKHNLIDHLRRRRAGPEGADTLESGEPSEGFFEEAGIHRGSWKKGCEPIEWQSPEDHLRNEEFWRVFHGCVSNLPPRMARAVLLKEVDGMSSAEIRAMLELSESNFWILLHRARLSLQRCLQIHWFR